MIPLILKKVFKNFEKITIVIVLLNLTSCATTQQEPTAELNVYSGSVPRKFTASLFAYIPDAGGDKFLNLIRELERRFERENKDIDLSITMDSTLDIYNIKTLRRMLGTDEGSFNMVEVDMVMLTDLISNNLVQKIPFPISNLGFFPSALEATKVGYDFYGVPTYLCGYYIYSWYRDIVNVKGGKDLINLLSQDLGLRPEVTALVGNFKGSYALPSLYVDAWADTHTNDKMAVRNEAYSLPLDDKTMSIFQNVTNLCGEKGGKCLSGGYKGNTEAERRLASGTANGYIGYSEKLFDILKATGASTPLPSVISATLGVKSNPEMFVDALVLNPNCQEQCSQDAATFSNFMSSLEVRNLIAFSEDASSPATPRYLLQALEKFYRSPPASNNSVYMQLTPFVESAKSFPNGFRESRDALNEKLISRLTN